MNTLAPDKDPIGQAVKAYHESQDTDPILVSSDIADEDEIPVQHLFSALANLPTIEQQAISECSGTVLDVGAAAGRHSLILQEQGLDVTALEISELCCEVMKQRGVNKVVAGNYYQYSETPFDTLLCLMNGIGIAGTLSGLGKFLSQANKLLKPGGKLIFDSSDIDFMYYEEDGSKWVDLNRPYHGEVNYVMRYKNVVSNSFPWLFIDFKTLAPIARKHGFKPTQLASGEHYDYLGMLKKIAEI